MIGRDEIDYLCIKSAEIMSKGKEEVVSEPYSEEIPKEEEEVVSKPYSEIISKEEEKVISEPYSEVISKEEKEVISESYSEEISKEEEEIVSEPYSEEIPEEEEEVVSKPYSEIIPKEKEEVSGESYDATFKVILFGDPCVPSTSSTQKFLTDLFSSDSNMTIGIDFEVKSFKIGEQRIKLEIWSFGEGERFKFSLSTYIQKAKGGLFLYDIKNFSSIEHIDDWLTVIRGEIKRDQFPIIAVGIIPDDENERQVSKEEAIKVAKSRDVDGFIECNLKTGENVEKVFEALTSLMLEGD